MEDPRDVFFDVLDIRKSRINTSKSPIVLLCGGLVPPPEYEPDTNQATLSLRHAVVKEHLENEKGYNFELFRPEEITGWQDDAIFKNLVQFEEQLAAICTMIILIIESPGSIAELGAFSQQNELQEKLMILKSSNFTDPSFIELGILKGIKESGKSIFPDPVVGFPWEVSSPNSIDPDVTVDVLESIKEGLKSVKQTEAISDDLQSHSTTIIRELIKFFGALTKTEVSNYLNRLNIYVSLEQLNQKLFLLKRFKLIEEVTYNSVYFCPTKEDFNTLRLSAVKGKRLDATTLLTDCLEFYKDKEDRRRLGAIKQHTKGGGE